MGTAVKSQPDGLGLEGLICHNENGPKAGKKCRSRNLSDTGKRRVSKRSGDTFRLIRCGDCGHEFWSRMRP